jgi:hypothetical protein
MEKLWKRTERAIAARLNGRRVPITGRARGDAPDIAHHWLSIEVKHRRCVPQWLHDGMSQAEAAARDTQLPLVILHEAGQLHSRDFVVMRLSDFTAWFGDVGG